MTTLCLELPDTVFSSLRLAPEDYMNEMKRAAAVKWYEMKRISQGKAAEICGVTRAEFLRILSDYKVSILQDDIESLSLEVEKG